MKIIIHYQEDFVKITDFTVSNLRNLENLIGVYPDEDIEGEIRPSAKNNPELDAILKEIYNHKLTLWKKTGGGLMSPMGLPPPHEKFLEVLEKNGLELKREFIINVNKSASSPTNSPAKKMWVGTRDEYIRIPVKDPDTIYSIVK
jgi:hypothetical protein